MLSSTLVLALLIERMIQVAQSDMHRLIIMNHSTEQVCVGREIIRLPPPSKHPLSMTDECATT